MLGAMFSSAPPSARRWPSADLCRAAGVAIAAALAAAAAHGQAPAPAEQRVWLQLGVFQARLDSQIRLDYVGAPRFGVPRLGTTLDFEGDLGMRDSKTVPFALLGIRLFDRWRVEFEAYGLNRSATRKLVDDEVTIGDTTYAGSVELQSRFDSRVLRASVGYSLLKTAQAEAGVALGVQQTRYTLSFTGVGRATGQPTEVRTVTEEDQGPLPTLGVYGSVELGPSWSVAGRLNYLPVSNRHGKGELVNLELGLSTRISPLWRLGGGYRLVRYKVDDKNSGELSASYRYNFHGPQLYVQAGF
jgi:hypothetical protein